MSPRVIDDNALRLFSIIVFIYVFMLRLYGDLTN